MFSALHKAARSAATIVMVLSAWARERPGSTGPRREHPAEVVRTHVDILEAGAAQPHLELAGVDRVVCVALVEGGGPLVVRPVSGDEDGARHEHPGQLGEHS